MKVQKPAQIAIALVVLIGGWFGLRHLVYTGVIPQPSAMKSVLPVPADEIKASVLGNSGNVKVSALPTNILMPPCEDGNTSNCIPGAVVEGEEWAWNANGSMNFGVGGAHDKIDGKGIETSKGSLAAKYGVNIVLHRQDDTGVMQSDLLNTAQKLVADPNASGVKFVTIMGDGQAQFAQALNPKLAALDGCKYDFKHPEKPCPEGTGKFITKTYAITGYSYGEDGFWGPPAWKNSCDAMKGGLTIGVLRDGDWNIAMKKLTQCGIPNNPDDKTYDPNAMNWVNADSYTKAAEMIVTPGGFCEDLPIKGKFGGGTKHICAEGVVTWTPGDVTVAKKKGGLVPIMTTKQSVFQMPCVIVGIDAWFTSHREEVGKLLLTTFDGADQVRVNPAALDKMGEIEQILYNEDGASPQYWVRYFKGVTEMDAQNHMVALGGSRVANLADNLQAFGMSGGPNLFAATYTTFGKIVVQQYPNLVPSFPPVSQILDTSFVEEVKNMGKLDTTNQDAQAQVKQTNAPMKTIEGKRNYQIQFASGSAEILPASYATLDQIVNELVITNYIVAVHGYTDDAMWAKMTPDDSAAKNLALSDARAKSVVAYLKRKGVPNTLRPYAHGQTEQIPGGRDVNRRVNITLGQ